MLQELLSLISASTILKGIVYVIIIAIVAIIALYLVNVAAKTIDKRVISPTIDPDRRARLHTVSKAAKSTLQFIILTIAVLIGMSTLGIDIGPALAAAGILGLAVSLGAQTLIKDMIGGLTILLEDEYRVGDTVRIGSVVGEVEGITLRRTDVRDYEGRLFMVPNGEVRVLANETRDWSRAFVELNFGLNTDLDKPMAALEKSLAKLSADPLIKAYLLSPPEIFGWNDIKDWAVVIRLSAKVTAGKKGDVARVMRQYALKALEDAGIAVQSSNRYVFDSENEMPVRTSNS